MQQPPGSRFGVATILRLLWHARLLAAAGGVLALIAGLLLVYGVNPGLPPEIERLGDSVGIAATEVLVDSRSSQAVDLGEDPDVIDMAGLIARTRLLSNLIATSPLRDQIARRAGIDPATFLATAPSIGADSPAPASSSPDVLNVMNATYNEQLPILTINTQSPDKATAARIASAAVTELTAYLGALAASDGVPDKHQLVIKSLSEARGTMHRGPRRMIALVMFAFVLGAWCIGILFVSRFRRGWREADPVKERERIAPIGTRLALPAVPAHPERPERRRPDVNA